MGTAFAQPEVDLMGIPLVVAVPHIVVALARTAAGIAVDIAGDIGRSPVVGTAEGIVVAVPVAGIALLVGMAAAAGSPRTAIVGIALPRDAVAAVEQV
jgi:hypothetical protein